MLDFWGCLGSCLFRRLPLYPFWLSQEPPNLLPIYFLHDSQSWFCCLQPKNADWHKYHTEKWTGSSFISPLPSWKTGEQKETWRTESLEHILRFLLTLVLKQLLLFSHWFSSSHYSPSFPTCCGLNHSRIGKAWKSFECKLSWICKWDKIWHTHMLFTNVGNAITINHMR